MKTIAASLLFMLLSGLASANERAPFKLKVVIDQNSIQEFLIDIDSYVSQELVLTDELRLSVIVNPKNSKNLESTLYSNGKVIHSAVQAKDADSDPNFYLICSGELAKFLSPLEGKEPSCPVPSA
ncbi:hypothetical protein [Microbulbifer pacificus]|uniref:Uncharacterized protein n=1 Tax=Microbulbifer pacificus TaxID=407164 RepID=A0AAU0N037_9GAMM|nr:hypothetical protein [Microbulbifer pacificus]WOX06129.1 hypothetical protein R5R33_03050 [Microbulbifer pacificus]